MYSEWFTKENDIAKKRKRIMKRRQILSGLLLLCLVLSAFPETILAEDSENTNDSMIITGENFWENAPKTWGIEEKVFTFPQEEGLGFTTEGMATYAVESEGEEEGGEEEETPAEAEPVLTIGGVDAFTSPGDDGWSYDAETGVLTLTGATINGTETYGIYASGDLIIEVEENSENTIIGTDYGIYVEGALTIRNALGKISVNTQNKNGYGIYSKGDMLLDTCSDITVEGGYLGVFSEQDTCVKESKITVQMLTTVLEYLNEECEPECSYVPFGLGANNHLLVTNSDINTQSPFLGMGTNSGGVEIQNSNIVSHANIYCIGGVGIRINGSVVNTVVDGIYSEDGIEMTGLPTSGIYSFDADINIVEKSKVESSGGYTGMCTDKNQAEMASVLINNSEVTANGLFWGIASKSAVSIDNSAVEAEATVEFLDALNSDIPPAGIIAADGTCDIKNNSVIYAKSVGFSAIATSDVTTIEHSNIEAVGLFAGIYSPFTSVFVRASSVKAHATVSFDEYMALEKESGKTIFAGMGIATMNSLEISESEIDAKGLLVGLLADCPLGEKLGILKLRDSTVQIVSGYLGAGAVSELEVTNSDVDAKITLSPDTALAFGYNRINGPQSGMFMLQPEGVLSTDNANISINGAWCGLGSDVVSLNLSNIEIEGGAYGVLGGNDVTITGCKQLNVVNSNEDIEAVKAAGGTTDTYYTSISATGNVAINNSTNVNVSGSYAGIASFENKLSIQNSAVEASGGSHGMFGKSTAINNSNVLAKAVWTQEECEKMDVTETYAILGIGTLAITKVDEIVGGEVGLFESEKSSGFTILDEDGLPAKTVSIAAKEAIGGNEPVEPLPPTEIASGSCGNSVNWILDSKGHVRIFTISEETQVAATYSLKRNADFTMTDFESEEESPWFEYRDQIISVEIEEGVKNVGSNSFAGCKNLKDVVVGDNVEYIGENAFSSCENLEKVEMGESVSIIESGAFSQCGDIDVEFKGDEPEVEVTAFEGSNTTVSYPAENETWTDNTSGNNYGDEFVLQPGKPVDVGEGEGEEPEVDPCEKGHDFSGEWIVDKEPTCTEKGHRYTVCTVCGKAQKNQTIDMVEHIYGEDVGFEWNTDHSECEAIRKCTNCETLDKKNCTISVKGSLEAECVNHDVVYTSTVEFDGITYNDVQTVTIKGVGHEFKDGVCIKCKMGELDASYLRGDVNEDGEVEIVDLRIILKGVCEKIELTERQLIIADVTDDGKVDIYDLRKELRYVCGKISTLD